MTDPGVYSEIVKVIPIVIGGLLAISGGIVGTIITHHLAEKREIKINRRIRLESFVKAIYEHDRWLTERYLSLVLRNQDEHIALSPLDEARMLQALHFPELADELLAIQDIQVKIMKIIDENYIARKKDQANWLTTWSPKQFHKEYLLYLGAIQTLTNKCRNILIHSKN